MTADVTPLRPVHNASSSKRRARKSGLADAALVANGSIVVIAPARFVTVEIAVYCSGYSAAAINSKIDRGDWVERREFVYAPDGRRLIDLRGYERWAQSRKEP